MTGKTLINKTAIRAAILQRAKATGRGEVLTRVDASVYAHLNAKLEREVKAMVHEHPSGYRTLKL